VIEPPKEVQILQWWHCTTILSWVLDLTPCNHSLHVKSIDRWVMFQSLVFEGHLLKTQFDECIVQSLTSFVISFRTLEFDFS